MSSEVEEGETRSVDGETRSVYKEMVGDKEKDKKENKNATTPSTQCVKEDSKRV